MTIVTEYIGQADAFTMRASDFTAAGFPGQPEVTWDASNGKEVGLSDAVALWLLARGDFRTPSAQTFGEAFDTLRLSRSGMGTHLDTSVAGQAAYDRSADVTGVLETGSRAATTAEQSVFENDAAKPVIPAGYLALDGGGLLTKRLWGRWHYDATFINTTGGPVTPTWRFKFGTTTVAAFSFVVPNDAQPRAISFDHTFGVNDFIGPYIRGVGKMSIGAGYASGVVGNAADLINVTRLWTAAAFAVASLQRFDITVQFAGASACTTAGNGSYFEIGRAV